jgi:hypothetical protein
LIFVLANVNVHWPDVQNDWAKQAVCWPQTMLPQRKSL